ncbi:MAG: iron-containing alcohol dehydrogenase [Holophaga sp.]|nr:iron-containing alcohol dehydrogenase [Holophaga sp.]
MQDFELYNPTRIVFGKGRIRDLGRLVPADAHVLVLYGGGSVLRTGTLQAVRAALGQRRVEEFGGIEPNPSYEKLMEAVELGRREQVDFLLAVGGGSVIDGTKFVAAAIPFQGEPWDILLKGGSVVERALPLGTVLTLPATGSEMNSGAVITRRASKTKLAFGTPKVFPVFSVLDPSLTFTLPPRQIANGVADAFVHVMEQYLTFPAGGHVQDRFAEGLLVTLMELGPKALAAPEDYEVRASLMWAATMALNGLIGAGVPQDWATHRIGHELTALFGIDHARTLAVVLPSLLWQRRDAKRAKLLQYGERVLGITSGSEAERVEAAIARTRAFFQELGIATRLGEYGVGRDALDTILGQLKDHGMTALGERQDLTLEGSRQVLADCF